MLMPNFAEAQYFLNILAPKAQVFTFQTVLDSENYGGNAAILNNVYHGTFEDIKAKLGAANNFGAGVFFMVNEGDGLRHNGAKTCRTAASVTKVRALFVDLDGAPLEPALKFKVTPSMVISTSPDRYHVYWLVDDCPLDEFKKHQQVLAKQLNGDPSVCDLPRVMRVPGFYHMKREPVMVKIFAPNSRG